MKLPASIPAIVLAECNLFPHALLPLNIFEPRYRTMLAESLASDRLLCVAMMKAAHADHWDEADENLHPFSCAGLLRACVGQPDGTSRIVLQGLGRIRLVDWIQREPFRIARLEPLPSMVKSPARASELAQHALDLARGVLSTGTAFAEQFSKQFDQLHDPEIIADVIGYNFLPCASERQPLLGMTIVEERLDYIVARLGSLPMRG